MVKAGLYAYRDRRQKKRQFRRLWIVRINAASRLNGLSYSNFVHLLKEKGVDLDRKVLAHLACLLYTSPSPRDGLLSRMPSSA